MLHSHIRTLASQFDAILDEEVFGIKWSSIELGAATAVWLQQPFVSPSKEHTRRIQSRSCPNCRTRNSRSRRSPTTTAFPSAMCIRCLAPWGAPYRNGLWNGGLSAAGMHWATRRDGRGVVKDVAFQWGFNDTAHFSRVFKKRFGQTPFQYWETTHPEKRIQYTQ